MHPVLFELPFKVFGRAPVFHSYGFIVALGFLAGSYSAVVLARRSTPDPAKIFDLTFWLLVAGLVGGRIMFIIVNRRDYSSEPLGMLTVWEGGFVWYGSLIAALATALIYTRVNSMPVLATVDALAPGVSIGHALGRIGCFLAGCCWGEPAGPRNFLAVTFRDPEALAPRGVPLHPVQLYESVGEMVIFLILLAVFRRRRRDGQVILTYLMLYPVLRSVTEIFRGDIQRGFLIPGVLSVSQAASMLVFLAALAALVALPRIKFISQNGNKVI